MVLQTKKDRFLSFVITFVSTPHKLFAVVLFFALIAVIGVLWQWQVALNKPFLKIRPVGPDRSEDIQQLLEQESPFALRQKDTDKDGLNDYDELNVYNTSPYLSDTDSDGYDDKTEIDNNQDPNCPAGKICDETPSTQSPQGSAQELLQNIPAAKGLGSAAPGILTQQLRELLVGGGADQAVVDALTDEQVVALFQGEAADKSAPGSSSVPAEEGNIQITPDLLRKVLVDAGVEQSVVEGISDQELMDLFQQIAAEQEQK